jgi:pSer/pThr/pTyr-binding forkhead associated (FHA) protein
MRGLYFIEQSLAKAQAEGLYQALQTSLAPVGLQLYEAKAGIDTPTSLMEACQKIYLSTLGIFDLSVPNLDTYLEVGISLGLNKPALIIAGQGMASAIPSILERANTWFYTPPLKPNPDLQRAVLRPLEKWAHVENSNTETQKDGGQVYCAFCGRRCKGWRRQTHGKGFLLLDGTHPQWNVLRDSIQSGVSPTGLTPIYLSQLKGRVMPLLCEMRLAVLASEFILLDASSPCNPEQYIALGIAISMRRPWLLATSRTENLPSLLRQASRLEYTSNQDLQQNLGQYILKSLYPARFAATHGATAKLELPFWLQLEDWIARFQVRTSKAMEGALQLLLIEEGQLKQRCRMTPDMTITGGRDPECDLLLESQSASRFHADFIFSGQELFVVDRQSTNGTFVNGNRVPANEQISLEIGDRVRIGPAEVVIWNEDELPQEVKQYLPESGRISPQTIFVNLIDGLVLANGKVPVARLSSSEINLLKFMREKGDDTTTSNEIAEIVYGTGKVSRMIVASFIDGLRAKIEPSPSNPHFLVAVPGIGYRLRTRGGQLVLRLP